MKKQVKIRTRTHQKLGTCGDVENKTLNPFLKTPVPKYTHHHFYVMYFRSFLTNFQKWRAYLGTGERGQVKKTSNVHLGRLVLKCRPTFQMVLDSHALLRQFPRKRKSLPGIVSDVTLLPTTVGKLWHLGSFVTLSGRQSGTSPAVSAG